MCLPVPLASSPLRNRLLAPGAKLSQDVLPILLQPLRDRGLSYPMQIFDRPLELAEGELGCLSVLLGFPCPVPDAFLARAH